METAELASKTRKAVASVQAHAESALENVYAITDHEFGYFFLNGMIADEAPFRELLRKLHAFLFFTVQWTATGGPFFQTLCAAGADIAVLMEMRLVSQRVDAQNLWEVADAFADGDTKKMTCALATCRAFDDLQSNQQMKLLEGRSCNIPP
jgi:hypothetical protein